MLVPPRIVKPPRTRRPLWAIAATVALATAGYFAITRARSVPAHTAINAVPTVTLSAGDVRQTLRVTGTLEAEKSVTLLAPRIQGSRSGLNRGGPGGGGGLDFNLVLLRLAKPGTM